MVESYYDNVNELLCKKPKFLLAEEGSIGERFKMGRSAGAFED